MPLLAQNFKLNCLFGHIKYILQNSFQKVCLMLADSICLLFQCMLDNPRRQNSTKNKYHENLKKHEMEKTFKPVFCKIPANVILGKMLMSNTNIGKCSITKITQLELTLQLIMLTLFSCFPLDALTGQTCSLCC